MATQYTTQIPPPHPHLFEPVLYISQVPAYVTDESLAQVFIGCGPFRPKINRNVPDPFLSGTIEFKFLEKAEQALATLQSKPIPNVSPPAPVILSPFPPTEPPTSFPRPAAAPRLVKHLPPGFTDIQLYELFRPFGPLASAHAHTHFGPDTGMVEFWREEDAREAETALHCADIEGSNIAVQVYQPRKASNMADFAGAPSFVPSGSPVNYPAQHSPTRAMYNRSPPVFVHGPGQQVQLAPLTGPGSGSHSGLIDPCNLFCKNLDPEIDSKSLFSHFKRFGQIVSARVMRNEMGESRGFGFVSFQTPDQATAALNAMNGVTLGSKQIIVRLHEPKQLRQEKLAQRFGHPRNSSGATSPTASEFGGDNIGWQSPRVPSSSTLGSPIVNYERQDRGRRGSGSYYSAALAGTLNIPMRYEDLSALTPNLRREILQGELSRRVKNMGTVPNEELDNVVEQLISLSLTEIVDAIHNPEKLSEHVQVLTAPSPPNDSAERSRSASQDSRLLDPAALNATASAPEHPSTPISVNATLSTPPRTSSPSGSVPPTSEKDRMLLAISKLEPANREELTELLMSLPKRERAMCLFNVEILRAKLVDAKAVLESEEEEPMPEPVTASPVTPKKQEKAKQPESAPQTPDLSSRGPSAAASPLPATPGAISSSAAPAVAPTPTHTIASLAKLPAAEIIRLANLPSTTGLPISKPDAVVVKATDDFIDSIIGESVQMQKQKLGDKLFKVVKAFGIKGAPKVTITLLDSEDLRALAHLMNSYPAVLKEKALLAQPSK